MDIFKQTSGEGKDIVLLHGWGGCTHKHMQPIAEQLKSRYRVTNMDLPGQGQSDWDPAIENIHDMADQLLPHLPKHGIYIGWSVGGLLSMSIANRYPERVTQLVGVAVTPKFMASENWPGMPQPGFKSIFTTGIKQHGYKSFMQAWFEAEFNAINPKPAAYHQLIELLDENASSMNLEILFKGIDIVDSTDLRNEFNSIQCPVDLILGEQDGSIPTDSHEKFTALNSKVNIHKIPKAGHLPFWTHPHEFNKVLNDIL